MLLLERGDLKMRKARAAFCLNFFGCAGFDIVRGESLADADLVVLCSSDAEYLALAQRDLPAGDGAGRRRRQPEGSESRRSRRPASPTSSTSARTRWRR